jgi:hypothetical protein
MPSKDIRLEWTFMALLVPLLLVFVFIYFSIYTVHILQAEPPPQFVEWPAQKEVDEQAAEPCLARAYWRQAVQMIQWKYGFGAPLPNNPPPEFRIDPKKFGCSAASDAKIELEYWQRLQKVWQSPRVWQKTYRWHTAW